MNEDAPTMSVGTGGFSGSAAATGPVAGFDPMLGKGKKVKKRKFKPKGHTITNVGIGESYQNKDGGVLPFLVTYDGQQLFILYGKSASEIMIELRKMYRPESHKNLKVTRLYPNQVIKFYWNKRQQAMGID